MPLHHWTSPCILRESVKGKQELQLLPGGAHSMGDLWLVLLGGPALLRTHWERPHVGALAVRLSCQSSSPVNNWCQLTSQVSGPPWKCTLHFLSHHCSCSHEKQNKPSPLSPAQKKKKSTCLLLIFYGTKFGRGWFAALPHHWIGEQMKLTEINITCSGSQS